MRFVAWQPRLGAVILMFLSSGAHAENPAREPAPTESYSAPLFLYEESGIDLLTAVRLTLEHDPSLLVQAEDVRFLRGVLQEVSGAFDWTLTGDFSYRHEEKELRRSAFQREQDRRDDLSSLHDRSCQRADDEKEKLGQLGDARNADPRTDDVRITADPSFDAQLALIDDLIRDAAAAGDLQRVQELTRTRIDFLDAEIAVTENLADVAMQSCTESGEDLARLGQAPELEEFDNAHLNLRLDKLFRNGVSFSPFLDGTFDSTQFVGKKNGFFIPRLDEDGVQIVDDFGIPQERFIDFGGKNVEDLYELRVGFDVNVPLLRGRGREAVAAVEEATGSDLEATALALRHAASQSVLRTVAAYWNLVAAQERLDILKSPDPKKRMGSVDLETELVRITRELIDGDELPRAELARVLASEADAWAQYQGAARDLVSARMELVRALGLDLESEANAPRARGSFPEPPSPAAIARLENAVLTRIAAENRYDLAAARQSVESGRVLARADAINQRSRLDVAAGAWATSVGESSLSETVGEWKVPSWSFGLFYEKPIGNNELRGRLAQTEAQVRQRQVNAGDLERNVRIGVVRAWRALVEVRDRLQRTEEAAGYFEETIAAEMEKFRHGDSTLVDTILTEQQRTAALLSLLAARQEVAVLVAQLRFETGLLVSHTEETGSEVTLESLTTLPGS